MKLHADKEMENLVVGMGHFEEQLESCSDLKGNFLKFLLTCQAIIGQHLLDSFPEPWEHDGSHHTTSKYTQNLPEVLPGHWAT